MPNAESVRELAGPFVWLFSTGISLTVLLLSGALYFWYKSRLRAMLKDGQDIADLAQKKDLLQTEIQRCDEWIKTSHEKLLRLDGERKIQEELRLELANLQKNAAQEQQKVSNSVKELDTIRATVLALSQDKDNLLKEKDFLNKQIESFKTASELNRKAAEDSVFKVRNLREELDMLTRKQKAEEERLSGLSKTVTELDATRQSLLVEAATKSEQLAQINKEKDFLSKQVENFKTALDLNKKASEDSVLKVQDLREELDLLGRKQKAEEERLSALSKTITELDTKRQSLMVEAATKSEYLSRINDKTEESRKTLQKLGAEISAFETVKENFNKLKKELEKTNAEKEQVEKTIKDLKKQESIATDNADNLAKESEAIRASIVALSQDKNNLLKERDSLNKQIEGFKTTSDLNKKAAEDSIFKAQSLKEDLDLLMRKQKEETERSSAISKTIIELDARKQSLMVEVATKSEQLAQINREKDYLSKETENFKTAFDLNKKSAEDSILKAKNLREELDLLERKQKEEEEKLDAVSKTVTELDAKRQFLMVEVATKSEQLAQINKEKDYLSKQTENFKTAFDLNKKAAEDSILKAKNLKEELDLLERKQKEEGEKLSALSKTVTELDARKKSLVVEVTTKSEQLSRINDKTEESRKTLQKLGAEISALETVKANFDKLKREFEKI